MFIVRLEPAPVTGLVCIGIPPFGRLHSVRNLKMDGQTLLLLVLHTADVTNISGFAGVQEEVVAYRRPPTETFLTETTFISNNFILQNFLNMFAHAVQSQVQNLGIADLTNFSRLNVFFLLTTRIVNQCFIPSKLVTKKLVTS